MRVTICLLFLLPTTGFLIFYFKPYVEQKVSTDLLLIAAIIFVVILNQLLLKLSEKDQAASWVEKGLKFNLMSKEELTDIYRNEGLEELAGLVRFWKVGSGRF